MLLFGCRDEFVYTIPTEPGFQYNMSAELSPIDAVTLRLTENISIGDELENVDRGDADVTFSGIDVPGGTLDMNYNPITEKYHLVREDFRVREGNRYDIEIIIANENRDTIRAFTEIPKAVSFSARFIRSEKIPIDSSFSHHEIEMVITFDEPTRKPTYYRFVPYRLESILRINNGGIDVVDFGTKTILEIAEVRSQANSVEFFSHKEGVIIDESRLSSSSIHLLLRTIKPLKDGDAVLAQNGKEFISRLHLDLFTMSEELYLHDRLIEQVNQGGNLSAGIRQVNNIRNATGVFGASSRTTIFFELR